MVFMESIFKYIGKYEQEIDIQFSGKTRIYHVEGPDIDTKHCKRCK